MELPRPLNEAEEFTIRFLLENRSPILEDVPKGQYNQAQQVLARIRKLWESRESYRVRAEQARQHQLDREDGLVLALRTWQILTGTEPDSD